MQQVNLVELWQPIAPHPVEVGARAARPLGPAACEGLGSIHAQYRDDDQPAFNVSWVTPHETGQSIHKQIAVFLIGLC